METVRSLNREVVEKRLPDMTLYMDLPIEEGLARTFDAAGDKHERE
jgi:thymidylate kinase